MTPRRVTLRGPAFALATAALAALASAAHAGNPPAPVKAGATAPLLRGGTIIRIPALEAELLAAINRFRIAHGRRPFRASPALRVAAARHSASMASRGFFDHEAPGGAPFWRRLERYYRPTGYRTWSVGENIAYGSPGLTAAAAVKEWLASPPHRVNLLSRDWRDAGLGAVNAAPAPGVFGNLPTTVITMDFGLRRR